MSRDRTLASAPPTLLAIAFVSAGFVLAEPARAQPVPVYQCPPGYYYDPVYGCVPPGYYYGPPYYYYPDYGFEFFYGGGWGQRWYGRPPPHGGPAPPGGGGHPPAGGHHR